MFLKLCKKTKKKNKEKKTLGFFTPLLDLLESLLSQLFLFHKLCVFNIPQEQPRNPVLLFSKNKRFPDFFFFVFVSEFYTAALPRGGQRRYGWKPCTLWFCPLPNALAVGWGAAAGCAVGAPYEAVGWLGSAKLWPKAVRSCPYPYWL